MKNVLVLLMVLAVASVANAALLISVDGVVNPTAPIELNASQTVVIDIYSDGTTGSQQEFYLNIAGPGTLDITQATNTVNPPGYDQSIFEVEPGSIFIDLAILGGPPEPPVTAGTIVDNIFLHCDAAGDVTLTLVGGVSGILDTQIIHQNVPEPVTLALLGLGGLLLRRRK